MQEGNMTPLILVSQSKKEINQFIEKKIKKNDAILIRIKRQKSEYSIDEIREVNREAHIYHQKLRIYYFEDFHLSSLPAQNAFLKLLEEPPVNVQFILSVSNTYYLLPTITSRAKLIKIDKKTINDVQNHLTEKIEKIVNQKTKKIPFSYFNINRKEDAITFLESLIFFFKKRLVNDKNSSIIIKEIIKIGHFIEKNNINIQLAIDHIVIFIYKCYNDIKQ